jgi:hypothetical protein
MANYDFILDDMRFSYSSLSGFETCKGSFKLSYVDAETRINNAFSSYGNLVHKILEMFFKGEIEIDAMEQYYDEHFDEMIPEEFPSYPQGMKQNYYNRGLSFFRNFSFNKNLYDIIFIEDYVNAVYQGINIVVKPDLILREKETGEYFLIDYKTAKLKTTKKDKEEQLAGYKKQFLLYCYFLWTEKNIQVKDMIIWFVRDEIKHVMPVDSYETFKTMEWVEDMVKQIKTEENWEFSNTKENKYFCENICGVRHVCPVEPYSKLDESYVP